MRKKNYFKSTPIFFSFQPIPEMSIFEPKFVSQTRFAADGNVGGRSRTHSDQIDPGSAANY